MKINLYTEINDFIYSKGAKYVKGKINEKENYFEWSFKLNDLKYTLKLSDNRTN